MKPGIAALFCGFCAFCGEYPEVRASIKSLLIARQQLQKSEF